MSVAIAIDGAPVIVPRIAPVAPHKRTVHARRKGLGGLQYTGGE